MEPTEEDLARMDEEFLNQVQINQPPPDDTTDITIALIVLAVLVFVGAVLFFYMNYQSPTKSHSPTQYQPPTAFTIN